ncbi:MAG: hypothetical protein RJA70_3974 [Pseudomonadota bacterium]
MKSLVTSTRRREYRPREGRRPRVVVPMRDCLWEHSPATSASSSGSRTPSTIGHRCREQLSAAPVGSRAAHDVVTVGFCRFVAVDRTGTIGRSHHLLEPVAGRVEVKAHTRSCASFPPLHGLIGLEAQSGVEAKGALVGVHRQKTASDARLHPEP